MFREQPMRQIPDHRLPLSHHDDGFFKNMKVHDRPKNTAVSASTRNAAFKDGFDEKKQNFSLFAECRV